MSVATIGAVDYAKALDGLSLKQAQLMLTTQGIVGEEQKDLLVKQGLIATSDRMSASLVAEALADNGLDKELQDSILIKAQLMNQDSKLLITENAITEAKLRAILAEKGIKGAKADTLIASILQTGQNTKEAISWDVLAASIKKSMIALAQNPLTWIAVAVGAVVGFIKVVDHFAITAEKLNEQLQELKATEEELISTQDKLTEIDGKIAEIQSKGTLSITDKADISRLEQEKLLLKDEIELLKLRKELQQDEYNKNAKKYADGQYSNYMGGKVGIASVINNYKGYKAKSERTDIDDYFIEDAKRGLKETEAELIEYRNTINENLANLAPDDEESRKKLETIREAIEKLIYTEEELAKIKFDRFIIDPNNTGISEGFEKIKSDGEVTAQEITELANKFPTLKKFMDDNGISAETLAAELNNVGTEAENSGKEVNKMTVSLSEMEKASDKISKLGSAFKELSDDGYITTKTLGELQTATGLSGDEWAEYENKLLNAKKGSADFNQVLSKLTYKILENEFATIDLTNATDEEITAIENKIAATLRENGVTNANAVAHEYVRMARVNATIAAYEAGQASYDSAAALISESLSAEQAKVAMNQLELAKINVNNAKITSSDDIDNIIAIANAALASEQTLKDLAKAKAELAEGFVGPVSKSTMDMMNGTYEFDFDKLDPSDFKVGVPRYTGGSSKSGSDKNKPDYEDPTDAIINRINLRAKELEQDEEAIQNKIELAEAENDYKKQISLTNDLIATRKKEIDALNDANAGIHNEAEYLRNTNLFYDKDGSLIDTNAWFDSQGQATEAYVSFYNSQTSKEEQERIKNFFENISKYKTAYTNNTNKIVSLNQEIVKGEKEVKNIASEVFSEIERIVKRTTDELQEQADDYDILIDKNQALVDGEGKFYETQKKIREAQKDITSELNASKKLAEWIDEDTRALLFNENDYDKLSNKLSKLQEDTEGIHLWYQNEISQLTEDNWYLEEAITKEYERRLEAKEREYEIARAELNLEKKRSELNNILSEKNVTMVIGGQLQQVADFTKVKEAAEEMAELEGELSELRTTNEQKATLALNQARVDGLNNEKAAIENRIKMINEQTDKMKRAIDDFINPLQNFATLLESLSGFGIPGLDKDLSNLQQNISSGGSRSGSYSFNLNPGNKVVKVQSNGKAPSGLSEGDVVLTGGGAYRINLVNSDGSYVSGQMDTVDYSKKPGYASGTNNASKGLHQINELGEETYISKDGTFHNFAGGEIVFTKEQSERLMSMIQSNYQPIPFNVPNITPYVNTRPTNSSANNTFSGNIIINSPRDYDDFLWQLSKNIGAKIK